MNKFIAALRTFFDNLSQKEFYYIVAGFGTVVAGVFIFLSYNFYSSSQRFKKEFRQSLELKKKTRELLGKHESVLEQKQIAETMLAQNKNFKLLEFFQDLTKQINLFQNLSSKSITSGNGNLFKNTGYTEVQMDAVFQNMNTQKLITLLDSIESTPRLFIKKIGITQQQAGQPFEVAITIASLQQQLEK
jgi:hypothetical protein